MGINHSDYIFALALKAQINVIFDSFHTKRDKNARIQKWKLLLSSFSEKDRECFKTVYSISLFDNIEIIVSINNFHVKRRVFFESRVFNFENFKQLLLIMAADYSQRYYDDEEFLTFCTEILFLGWLCYKECKQEKFTRYAFYLVLCVLQVFRKKSQFNVYSYSRLNEWAKKTMKSFNNSNSSDIESLDLTQSPEESSGDSEDIETQNLKKLSEESDSETYNSKESSVESNAETQNMEETSVDSKDVETQYSEQTSDDSEEVETENLEKSSMDSGNVKIHSSKKASKDSRETCVRCALISYLRRRSEVKKVTHGAQSSKLSEQMHVIRADPKCPVHKINSDTSRPGAGLTGKIISQEEIQPSNEPSTSYNPPDRTARLPLHRFQSDPMLPKIDFQDRTDVRRQNVIRSQSFSNFCTNTAVPVQPSTSYNPPDRTASVPLHRLRSDPMHPKLYFQSDTDVRRQNLLRSQSFGNFCTNTAIPVQPPTSYNPPDRTASMPLLQLRSDPILPKLDFQTDTDVRRQNLLRSQSFSNFCTNTAVPVQPSTSYNPPDRTASVSLHRLCSDSMHPKLDFRSHTDVRRQNVHRSQSLSDFCSNTGNQTDTYNEKEKPIGLSTRAMNVSAKKESSSRIGDSTRDSDSVIEKKDASSPKISHDV